MGPDARPWSVRYGAALLVTGLAFAARLALAPWLGTEIPAVTFFPAVALAVWYGGWGPGLLTAGLGGLLISYFFMPPLYTFNLLLPVAPVYLAYGMSSGLIVLLGELARRRRLEAERMAAAHRRSEQRARLLVALDDALRPLDQPHEVTRAVATLAGEHLEADRVFYAELEPDGDTSLVSDGYVRGLPEAPARLRLAELGPHVRQALERGEPVVIAPPATGPADEPAGSSHLPWQRLGNRAALVVPVLAAASAAGAAAGRGGGLLGWLYVGRCEPAGWSLDQQDLAQRVANRCREALERVRASQALRTSEAEFRSLFELSTVGVTQGDATTHRFLRVNQRFCEITGYPAQALKRMTFRDVTHPADRERDWQAVQPVLCGERDEWEVEKRYVRGDGSIAWVHVAGRMLKDAEGRPWRTIANITDLTASREAESRLQESEQRFRVAQDSSLIPFVILSALRDDAGRIVDFVCQYANAAAARWSGLSADAIVGRRLLALMPGHRATGLFDDYVRVTETGEPHSREAAYTADGLNVTFHNVCSRLEDGVAVWFMDITQRTRMERQLEASREELRLVADTAAVMLAHCDRDERFLFVNRPYAERLGRQPEQLVGLRVPEVMSEGTYNAIRPYMRRALAGQRVEFEFLTAAGDDGERYLRCIYVPEQDPAGGDVHGFVAALTDVTEHRLLEQQLRQDDQRKDEFLATLAHELRNPLAPIRSAVDYMKLTGGRLPSLQQPLELIERQTNLLTRLVDDLLDLSRLSRGRVELRRGPLDLRDVGGDAAQISRTLVEAADQALTVQLPDQPLPVDGDAARLSQVFSNLLNNAAKYTPRGGRIELTAARAEGDAVVTVRDTGVGIPPEMLGHIFEMFAQADTARDVGHGGLGIGLTLCKQLVDLHGGHIEAASEGPGRGSTFSVRLPLTNAPRELPGTAPVRAASGADRRRVLVCDDNVDAALGLGLLLETLGHEVRTAHDGLEALTLAESFRPEVALLDIGMPGLDGYETARRIRALPGGDGIRLVAVTGWGQERDKRQAREAGFDEHLTKPVDLDEIHRLLQALPAAPC